MGAACGWRVGAAVIGAAVVGLGLGALVGLAVVGAVYCQEGEMRMNACIIYVRYMK